MDKATVQMWALELGEARTGGDIPALDHRPPLLRDAEHSGRRVSQVSPSQLWKKWKSGRSWPWGGVQCLSRGHWGSHAVEGDTT